MYWIFFRPKINWRNKQERGGGKGGELPFIYKTLDLNCVETVRFENIDFVAKSGMRCDVNLKMTYFLRGKQFCIALKAHSAILLYHAT